MPAVGKGESGLSSDLAPGDFAEFFQALHKVKPFPWQQRLAERVSSGGWPLALDIPTGAGKTAVIDVAVFHLALEAARGPSRRAAVRILFVVDRRLIVDDAYRRAVKIADKLAEADGGIIGSVADRLRLLAEKAYMPLRVVRLRGGMPKEPDWVRTPAQPTVVVSTVDQVGSRFLFRGYGVSDSMKPVHAGLLGSDALLILDEAHLSQPFVQTARDTKIFQKEPWAEKAVPAPFEVVTLSATYADHSEENGEEPFRITNQDRADQLLGERLNVSKRAELIEINAGERAIVEKFADQALEFVQKKEHAPVIAVVVNRVRRAREIFETLLAKGAHPFADASAESDSISLLQAALLIGRTRDLDRNELTKTLIPRIEAGRESEKISLIVVATQCIEAGADLDFDALVTEIAPLDCLRQRFGRVNRMGRTITGESAIIASSQQIRKSAPADPIYGDAPRSTWNLLLEKSEKQGQGKMARNMIDFGVEQSILWIPQGNALKEYLAPRNDAPVLMPSAIEFWSRTSPRPAVDPEISLYLHGPKTSVGDVEIVWRADLDDDINEQSKGEVWKDHIWVCPPSSLEAISVPIADARLWLGGGQPNTEMTDVEAAADDEHGALPTVENMALLWRGKDSEQTRLISAPALKPGDVIVVPSRRGGCDRWGWAPNSHTKVSDLGREANRQQRGRYILRLSAASSDLTDEDLESIADMKDWSPEQILDQFGKYLEESDESEFTKPRVVRSADGKPLAIERKQISRQAKTQSDSGEAVTEDDESLRGIQKRILLADHSKGVEHFAGSFAERAGLPSEIVEDIALAGYLHDAGKAHPEFKRLLYGGDELATLAGPDLAKSARLPESPAAWKEAQRQANLPQRARHEVASICFAEAHPALMNANDRDLVLWLIGTHHGYGRPFFDPPEREWPRKGETFESDLGDGLIVAKPARSLAELTGVWLELADRLARHYGAWGLARLEAILRLADHRRSEAEQNTNGNS